MFHIFALEKWFAIKHADDILFATHRSISTHEKLNHEHQNESLFFLFYSHLQVHHFKFFNVCLLSNSRGLKKSKLYIFFKILNCLFDVRLKLFDWFAYTIVPQLTQWNEMCWNKSHTVPRRNVHGRRTVLLLSESDGECERPLCVCEWHKYSSNIIRYILWWMITVSHEFFSHYRAAEVRSFWFCRIPEIYFCIWATDTYRYNRTQVHFWFKLWDEKKPPRSVDDTQIQWHVTQRSGRTHTNASVCRVSLT